MGPRPSNNKTDSESNKIHTVTKIVQNKPIVTISLSLKDYSKNSII